MNDELRRLFDSALERFGPARAVPAAVHAKVARRGQERWRVGLTGLAVVTLAAGLATLARGADGSAPVALPSVSASPSPSPTPSPTPTPSRSPTSSPTPAEEASSEPPAAPPVRYYAWPTPGEYEPLRLALRLEPRDGTTQTPFSLVVTMTDGDGYPNLYRVDWGDGSEYHLPRAQAQPCPVVSPTADPGPYQPTPRRKVEALPHAWRLPGEYTIRAYADSEPSGGCGEPYGLKEEAEATLTVRVGDGPRTSNGPARPFVDDDTSYDSRPPGDGVLLV